jgi:aryl-alcohol dehydrogenase-like predicted oxidoreductase
MRITIRPERSLGATGVAVPLLGYGTAPLGKPHITRAYAVDCLNYAIDCGVTYLDTSPDYGSEPHVGEVVRTRRHEVFLATKVNTRRRDDVLHELEESLRRLQTDHVDLVQIHAVNAWADLEQALAPDGALAALGEARDRGMTRFIGITGHARPDILAHALRQYGFDTVLCALGVADHLVSAPDQCLLPVALEKETGVVAMKVYGHGTIDDRYLALRYALGLRGVALAIIGMDQRGQIDENVAIASDFHALTEEEEAHLISRVRPLVERDADASKRGPSPLFWLHDTSVTGWKHASEPALVEY